MRRPALLRTLLLALAVAPAVAGCGREAAAYPPECSNGPAAISDALDRAPGGEVAVEGVRLSECLVPSGEAGPLMAFGGSVVQVTADLAARAESGDPRAALKAGFLRGALERGADPGIHDELLFRLDQELSDMSTRSPEFRRGRAAGLERG